MSMITRAPITPRAPPEREWLLSSSAFEGQVLSQEQGQGEPPGGPLFLVLILILFYNSCMTITPLRSLQNEMTDPTCSATQAVRPLLLEL